MSESTSESIYLRMAALLAQRSRCSRLRVGCVVTSASGVVLGASANMTSANGCSGVAGACGCEHAEWGAIGVAYDEREIAHVYVTHQPCAACAQGLIWLGGVRVVRWLHPYRLPDGAELLAASGIDARRVEL